MGSGKRAKASPRARAVRVDTTGAAVTHWDPRAWRGNLDEVVPDPQHPQAFPDERPADLLGRIRVRLSAEDGHLVAYGFGGQRIAIPAAEIGAVHMVDGYRIGRRDRGAALLVLDQQKRIMLRAGGQWATYGDAAAVCRAAGAPPPAYRDFARRAGAGEWRPRRYATAPGCQRLRTAPRGTAARVLVRTVLCLATVGGAAIVGVLPALALPGWTGSVRVLLGIAGAVLGAAAGIWLWAAACRLVLDALRWVAASVRARTVAPARRFFGQERSERRQHSEARSWAVTLGLVALVPALIGWGPGVGIDSLVHGLSDSRLVADLRAHGESVPGMLIDAPAHSTGDDGQTTVTDVATLEFRPAAQGNQGAVQALDPPIGGRPLPLDSRDPEATRVPVTVVCLPGDPATAAARQQIAGSVWHGAPTANLIVGSLFTVALPGLIFYLAIRVRRQRLSRNATLIDDFAAAGSQPS
jgi:hypothetical protein